MKKLFLMVLMLFVITAVAVFAEGKQEASEQTTGEEVTLKFWFPRANAEADAYWEGIGERFTKKHPNIKIENTILPFPHFDQIPKLKAAKLAGNEPDVFYSYLIFVGLMGTQGEFASLNDYIEDWEGKDDFLPAALRMGNYKGDIVGLGFFPAPNIGVYRKDFAKESGLDPEVPPSDWESLENFAVKTTKTDANNVVTRSGFDLPIVDKGVTFYEPFFRQNGAVYIDEMDQLPKFDEPEMEGALSYLVNLYNQNVTIPFDMEKRDEVPFVNDRAAMAYLFSSAIPPLLKDRADIKDDIGFAPVIKGPVKKAAFCGYRLMFIYKTSKHKDAAWEFIKFTQTEEEMWNRYEETGIPPVRASLFDKYIQQNPDYNRVFLDYVENGWGKAVVPWNSISNNYLSLAIEAAMRGEKTVPEALSDAQKKTLEEIKTFTP